MATLVAVGTGHRIQRRREAERRRRVRQLRAGVGLVVCVLMTLLYLGGAYEVMFGLHVGHVVQDGVDTGDLLGLPFLVMAAVSAVLAIVCCDALSRSRLPSRRRAR